MGNYELTWSGLTYSCINNNHGKFSIRVYCSIIFRIFNILRNTTSNHCSSLMPYCMDAE